MVFILHSPLIKQSYILYLNEMGIDARHSNAQQGVYIRRSVCYGQRGGDNTEGVGFRLHMHFSFIIFRQSDSCNASTHSLESSGESRGVNQRQVINPSPQPPSIRQGKNGDENNDNVATT